MASAPPSPIVLYTRPGCHLCDDARGMLDALLADRARRGLASRPLEERDITLDQGLERRLFEKIPVVEVGARRLELVTSLAVLRRFLDEALDPAAPTVRMTP
jgi:hypothetical protein